MAFTYDPTALSAPLNHLRFLVQDTVEAGHSFEDSEIDFVASEETNIYRAAARLCRALAAKFNQLPGYEDKLIVKPENKAETYLKLAKDFDKKADDMEASLTSSSSDAGLRLPKIPCPKPTFVRNLHFTD